MIARGVVGLGAAGMGFLVSIILNGTTTPHHTFDSLADE